MIEEVKSHRAFFFFAYENTSWLWNHMFTRRVKSKSSTVSLLAVVYFRGKRRHFFHLSTFPSLHLLPTESQVLILLFAWKLEVGERRASRPLCLRWAPRVNVARPLSRLASCAVWLGSTSRTYRWLVVKNTICGGMWPAHRHWETAITLDDTHKHAHTSTRTHTGCSTGPADSLRNGVCLPFVHVPAVLVQRCT